MLVHGDRIQDALQLRVSRHPSCSRSVLEPTPSVHGPVIKDLIDWSVGRSTQGRSLHAAEPRPCASDGAKHLRASHFATAHIANQPLAGAALSGWDDAR
jgi:hypothetical protein